MELAAPVVSAASDLSKTPWRVLSLDGGGAKGFYTLGVLREVEAMIGCPLHERFDLVFGTSTGAIIAALIALGKDVDQIHALYQAHVPQIMHARTRAGRSRALESLAAEVFGAATFADVQTHVGIVATRWLIEKPMIFKGSVEQAHGRRASFVPGFGCTIADAVVASCSAFPFFDRKVVTTSSGDIVELVDGGYCANNPTLYAIADSVSALGQRPEDLRVLSVGVGVYPEPHRNLLIRLAKRYLVSVQLLQKTLEFNTQSMDQLRSILFKSVATVRISETFEKPEMATDLMEYDLTKLNMLRQRGCESFASREDELKHLLL